MVQLQVGDVLESRYRIDHPIARGGMSTVYRCVDLRLGRAVAAKVMEERYVKDSVFRQRFRREARAMAQLSHPNLVNVYDFGSDGEHLYLVMELIRGGTLRELLAERGPMPPHAATAVLRSLLTGLSVAHAAGMVHRDIKPDNVLINDDRQVKLADFGLVRAASRGASGTDQIVGTVAYLSPEQVEGAEIGAPSDVYSAGILLFELLTGSTPFTGDTDLAHAFQRLDHNVPAPSSRIEGVPQLFDELVGTATARSPEDRFTDAAEFLAALDDVAADLQLPAFKVPVPRNAAAHRAAAVPTDTSGIVGPLAPTGIIDTAGVDGTGEQTEVIDDGGSATEVIGSESPGGHAETSILPPVTPGAQETSVYPIVDPIEPSVQPGAAVPATAPDDSEAEGIDAEDENPGPKPVSNRSRGKLIAWLVVVAVLVAAIAVGGWWFGSGRYGEIPQVLGMEQAAAVSALEEAGFPADTREVYSDEIPESQIVGTDPAPGDRIVRGDAVTMLVSRGQPVVPGIPQNRSLDTLRELLAERDLAVTTGDPKYSDTVAEGGVVSTDPSPGTTVPTDTTVTVHLSRGAAPVSIPDVSGLSSAEARDELEQAGLGVSEVVEVFDGDTDQGDAIGTQPASGESVSRGTPITLQISNALQVPDVEGLSRQAAEKKLQEAGFSVSDASRDSGEVADSADEVVAVSPGVGELVDPANPVVSLALPGKVEVPRVTGKKVADARDALEDAGLKVKTDDDADARVYRQSPKSGEDVSPGATVTLRAIG